MTIGLLEITAAGLFALAVVHTFSTRYFEHLAHTRTAHAGIWHLLGEVEGRGFVQLMQQLPQERLLTGIVAVVVMELAVEETTKYAKDRHAFGKPLFALQNTRFELAECATIARVSRVFLDDCIEKHLRGELDVATAAMAKYWLTDRQCEVVDRCLQLFGGYGYMIEYPIARMYTDSRVQKIYAGSNEIMKELVARSL